MDGPGQGAPVQLSARQSLESTQARSQLETSGQQLTTLRLQSEAADREVANVEEKLKLQVQTARLVADAATRIKFENIDKENFLLIVAPVDGVITEHDRAFLREGLPVQLKFNAFPYQRYGLIRGTLQFISPATKPSLQTKQPVYEGRVTLEQD